MFRIFKKKIIKKINNNNVSIKIKIFILEYNWLGDLCTASIRRYGDKKTWFVLN